MRYDPKRHHRRSIRLQGRDYAQAGAYFVTMLTQDRACLFGDVVNGEMQPNGWGDIVRTSWMEIPRHFAHTQLDAFVVMPNHVHGIIVITDDVDRPSNTDPAGPTGVGATRVGTTGVGATGVGATGAGARDVVGATHASPLRDASPLQDAPRGPRPQSLGAIVGSFKSAVARRINAQRDTAGASLWQRGYYEHIIRNETEWQRLREYIANNPARWLTDADYPQPAIASQGGGS